jgi:hypothetical protein
MLNLEAVIYGMWLNDRHCPSDRIYEGGSRGRGRRMVAIVIVCRDGEKRHGKRIRKVGRVERNRKLYHRSKRKRISQSVGQMFGVGGMSK